MSKTVKVLSIDGGGVKGLIPATVLAAVEHQTRQPISQSFDLVAGSSVGGILALGLAKPGANGAAAFSAAKLCADLEAKAPAVFRRSPRRVLASLGGLIDEKYSDRALCATLEKTFGAARLGDATTNVLVTAYDIDRREPVSLSSARVGDGADYRHMPMMEAARATAAAPSYFEPLLVEDPAGGRPRVLVDGGVGANNPAACALAHARTLFPDAEEFLVVSLGTGASMQRYRYRDAKDWGLIRWAGPLVGVAFGAQAQMVDKELAASLPDRDGEKRYYRFQAPLSVASEAIDDGSCKNLRGLKRIGKAIIEQQAGSLAELCAQLRA